LHIVTTDFNPLKKKDEAAMSAIGTAHVINNLLNQAKMANTYHQIYLHTIFAVKYRNAVIDKKWKGQLLA